MSEEILCTIHRDAEDHELVTFGRPLIRCKDCVHYFHIEWRMRSEIVGYMCKEWKGTTHEFGYCYKAKRRENHGFRE